MNLQMKTLSRLDDLRAALQSVRQATTLLPTDMEELLEDLRWVEESVENAIAEASRQEEERPFSPLQIGMAREQMN